MRDDKVLICIRVPSEFKKSLIKVADYSGTTMSAQVNIAIAEYIEKFKEKGVIKNA